MKRVQKFSMALLILALLCACFPAWAEQAESVDFASSLALDMQSETVKQAVTVKTYVDGDTTHFRVPESVCENGVLKARYIGLNTPESTGRVEEWGKAASRFTRDKLENAEEILIESDDGQWNLDSTSTRYLVWVWYRPKGAQAFRCLNIELLQNGLAIANSSAQNRYGDTCMAAIAQAKAQKLNIYSGEKDPDFYYGDAIELTLRELRLHPEAYEGKKVAFLGVITLNHDNAVFIEDYDEETGLYFGITAFYGFNMSGGGLEILTPGNEVRIVGTLQYYEQGHAWQIAGMTYRMMKPKDPGNIQKISDGHEPSWKKTDPESFWETVALEMENGAEEYPFALLAMNTSVSMIVKAEIAESGDPGLLCLECSDCGPDSVLVYAPASMQFTQQDLGSHTLLIHGIVVYLNDTYCIRVYTQDGITFLD